MVKWNLSPGVTIRDVLDTLEKPEEYTRVALMHLSECARENGNAAVRLGITGTGKVPYHKIVFLDSSSEEQLFEAYDGQHAFGALAIQKHTWSSASMNVTDVRQLLGELRGFKVTKAIKDKAPPAARSPRRQGRE